MVDDPLPQEAVPDAGVDEQVRRPLLQDPRADALLDVLAAAVLEHDRLDALQLEQPGERQPGRPRADDSDLGPLAPHRPSSRTRWKTANALFAAGTPQ